MGSADEGMIKSISVAPRLSGHTGWASSACTASARLDVMLASLKARTWQPPAQGISLDPAETVTATLACTHGVSSLRDGLVHAVTMGGDADTVATITGGLLGGWMTVADVLAELPWYAAVLLPDAVLVTETSSALAATVYAHRTSDADR
jgi:hypothetical protein